MTGQDIKQLHATCVAIDGRGVILRGPPGSGKSDLALRLIDEPGFGLGNKPLPGKLVGDDQIILQRRADELVVSPAGSLAGLLEIRGTGIICCPHRIEAPLALVVDLVAQSEIERLPAPDASHFEALGVTVRRIEIDASQPSAAARVRAGLTAIQNDALDRPA